MSGDQRGRFCDFRIRMRRAEQPPELSRDISERRLGLEQTGSIAISRVEDKTVCGVLASREGLDMIGPKRAHGHREQLPTKPSHLASFVTISCVTSNTARRVVGQWGGAGGAICEDHFAFCGELLGFLAAAKAYFFLS